MNILYLIKDILVIIGRGVLRCGIVFNFKFLIFKKKKSRKKKLKSKIIFSQRKRKFARYCWRWIDFGAILIILLASVYLFYKNIISDLPNVNTIYNPPRLSTKILDRNDKILFKFYEDEDRSWVSLDKIPQNLIKATIAIEDKEFYDKCYDNCKTNGLNPFFYFGFFTGTLFFFHRSFLSILYCILI